MPRLSDPRLQVDLVSGSATSKVTASVDVTFTAIELRLIELLGLEYRAVCRIRGADDWLNGPDNALFTLGTIRVTANQNNLQFTREVSNSSLDEDASGADEVYARFWCNPPTNTGLALTPAKTVDSSEVHLDF